ncbi:MAG TPA: PAS domain-containing protein, partial [Elusimicrobiota bacterium]|nr:PAS domain-containing protein [Elusimicrobiota bacterium]
MPANSNAFLSAKFELSDLINAFPTAIYVKDRGHRCVMLNDACCRALGRSRKDLIGKTEYDFLAKREADELRLKEDRIFAKRKESREDETFTDSEGVKRTYATTRTLFTDRSGRAWLIGVMHDVTMHQKILSEARFMTSLLAAENETSSAGILIVDDAGRVLTINRRFREMWGLPARPKGAKAGSTTLRTLARAAPDPADFRQGINHLHRRRNAPSRDEITLRDGRTFDRYSSPVVDDDGVYYGRVWHFHDLTELRKVSALKAEVERRRQLDALKDQFIGTISHELRTPLTIVRSAVDSLRRGVAGELTPAQREIADLCSRNILRLSRMIFNLLDISRLESGRAKARLERLELRPLLADMEANF